MGGMFPPKTLQGLEDFDLMELGHPTQAYLSHSPEHLVTAPFWETPIIIVLFHSPYTNRAVAARATSQESSSRNVDLTIFQPRLWRSDEVPISLPTMVLGPATQCQNCSLQVGSTEYGKG